MYAMKIGLSVQLRASMNSISSSFCSFHGNQGTDAMQIQFLTHECWVRHAVGKIFLQL